MPSLVHPHRRLPPQTIERLNAGVPAGSPLTAAEAMQLFTAGHDNRNYLAAGALGPDLFFLLPDFKGDLGTGLMTLIALRARRVAGRTTRRSSSSGRPWMAPVLDEGNQLANGISGGMLGEIGQVQALAGGAFTNMAESLISQMEDIFGLLTSGTQAGYEDSSFFWSDVFHYRKTYHFARTLYKNALNADAMKTDANEPSRVPKQQAFALGWISHCATDVAGHPFTNAKVRRPVPDPLAASPRRREPHGRPCLSRQARHRSDGVLLLARHVGAAFPAVVPARSPTRPSPRMRRPPSTGSHRVRPSRRTRRAKTSPHGQPAHDTFDVDSGPLPEHICQLLIDTMKDVYGGPGDMSGPQVLSWDGTERPADGPAAPGHVRLRLPVREVQHELRAVSADAEGKRRRHHRPRPATPTGLHGRQHGRRPERQARRRLPRRHPCHPRVRAVAGRADDMARHDPARAPATTC